MSVASTAEARTFMALYTYKALDASGIARSGQIEAGAREAALDVLHRRGLVPIDLSDIARATSAQSFLELATHSLTTAFSRDRLRDRDLVSATHALAALLKAGLTVDRALSIAASLATAPPIARFFADLAQGVRAGATLTAALRTANAPLPVFYFSMIEAGELGGTLPQTLARVSELLQKNLDVKERMQSALIYPLLLACVVLGTLVVLIAFVLPRFQNLFAESEAQLPWATQAVLALGNFSSRYWWLIVAVLVGALLCVRKYAMSESGRIRIDRWLLRSRLTFGLPAAIDTARMLRTLSTLLQNGVTLSAALRVSQGTLSNADLRSALEKVTRSVNAGEELATSMAAAGVFPGEAVQLARVGEETGRLHELLAEAASILETNAARTLERLLALMVPALTVLMGLIVAALIGSVLVGLLSINELAA